MSLRWFLGSCSTFPSNKLLTFHFQLQLAPRFFFCCFAFNNTSTKLISMVNTEGRERNERKNFFVNNFKGHKALTARTTDRREHNSIKIGRRKRQLTAHFVKRIFFPLFGEFNRRNKNTTFRFAITE